MDGGTGWMDDVTFRGFRPEFRVARGGLWRYGGGRGKVVGREELGVCCDRELRKELIACIGNLRGVGVLPC